MGKPEMPLLGAVKANRDAGGAPQIRHLNALLTESPEMPPQSDIAEPALKQQPVR